MSDLLDDGAGHPVRLVSTDDLQRSRITVLFRFLLAIPHAIWVGLYGIAAYLVALAAWLTGTALGRIPAGMHEFLARYVRYRVHVGAYMDLAANPFPPFSGAPGAYPVSLEIDPPAAQSRLTVFFRLLLAIPALIVSGVLNYLIEVVAVLGWFHALAMGRQAAGFEKLLLYALRYQAQTNAYAFFLTSRYPAL